MKKKRHQTPKNTTINGPLLQIGASATSLAGLREIFRDILSADVDESTKVSALGVLATLYRADHATITNSSFKGLELPGPDDDPSEETA